MKMDIQKLIDCRLEQGRADAVPQALIIVGPIGVGKTTFRKAKLSNGYVQIDSADIFHELSAGDATLDFPDAFASEIEHCVRAITQSALRLGLNIVLETPGHEATEMVELIEALRSVGYHSEVIALTADRAVCEAGHASRGDSVSSYWAAPLHVGWVVSECKALAAA